MDLSVLLNVFVKTVWFSIRFCGPQLTVSENLRHYLALVSVRNLGVRHSGREVLGAC